MEDFNWMQTANIPLTFDSTLWSYAALLSKAQSLHHPFIHSYDLSIYIVHAISSGIHLTWQQVSTSKHPMNKTPLCTAANRKLQPKKGPNLIPMNAYLQVL